MGAIVIIDPNVLIAAAENDRLSLWSLEGINERNAEMAIGVDADKKILDAYINIQPKLLSNRYTEAFIRLFLRPSSGKLVRIQNTGVEHTEHQWLTNNHCGIPIEPELVIVAAKAAKDAFLLVLGGSYKSSSIKVRGSDSPSIVETLHKKYPTLQIWSVTEISKKLSQLERSRYPANEQQLLDYIKSDEYEYKEFKQPADHTTGSRVDVTTWNKNIIKQALKAVCGMVNSDGGCVLVGVNPSKQIIGIDPVLDHNGQPDDDMLSRRFSDHFDSLQPCVNLFVKPAIIPLKNGRRVVLLHVFKGIDGVRYNFDDGEKCIEWDRCGASTKKGPYVGRSKKRW